MTHRDYTKADKIVFVLISFWAVFSLYDWAKDVCLYLLLPISFIIVSYNNTIYKRNRCLQLLSVLYLWFVITSFFSVNTEESFIQVKRTVATFLMCYVFAAIGYRHPRLGYCIYILFFLALLYYAYNNIMSVIDVSEERMQDENVNANMFAYYTCFATFSVFLLGDMVSAIKKAKIFKSIFFILIPISFMLALYTGSRQLLIIQVPLITLLLCIRYIRNVKGIVLLICIFVALGVAFLYFGESMYNNSTLSVRNGQSVEDDERTYLLFDAFRVGFENFIVGVGPGCYKLVNPTHHYAHCAYAELIACSGLPALIIYLIMIYSFVKEQVNRYLHKKNKLFLAFGLFGIVFAIQNVFYAFYLLPWLMAFFLLVSAHSDNLYYKLKKGR